MSTIFCFPAPPSSPEAEALRDEVRSFLSAELTDLTPLQRAESWSGFDAEFSRKVGTQGWIGMSWPKRYGGHERSMLERYVVLEEMLASGAPVAAHWVADRQSGPNLLRYGTEEQRQRYLPSMASGERFFCIGMSEPDSGSDLAATRTQAVRVTGGWVVNGTKLWTTNAHKSHTMVLFCRTGKAVDPGNRHGGTSQFLVDLELPGISIRSVVAMTGEHHFNEVVFADVFLPDSALLGKEGEGWSQVMGELVFERSGPERFLSTFRLLVELMRSTGRAPSERTAIQIGRFAAHIASLRRLSRSVAELLAEGADPTLQASMVKDLGAVLEQEIPEIARQLCPPEVGGETYASVLAYLTMHAPSFSLRGGTREILRGIIARGLGLR